MASMQPIETTRSANSTASAAIQAETAVRPSRLDFWAAAAVATLVIVVFWPTLTFQFVNWDDPWYVINNPLIRSWHPSNLARVATEVVTRNYAPVTIGSFLVDHTFWGLNAGGYHWTNNLLHALNAVLVYVLLVQLTRNRFIGWTAAALFAIHPVQIETVAWISSRKGLLSGAFILATLICWLRPHRSARSEVWGFVFFALALLSKAIAVVVPAVVVLYDVLILNVAWSVAIRRQMISGLMAVWLLVVTMSAQTTELGGVRSHVHFSKWRILAIDSVIVWRYIGMLLWPRHLCVLYDPPTEGVSSLVVAALAAWLVVAVVIASVWKRRRLSIFAFGTFIVLLVPVLNLFPITTLMNDRYLYLPCIPFFGLTATAVAYLFQRIASAIKSRIAGRSTAIGREIVRNERLKPAGQWIVMALAIGLYANATRQHLPVWSRDRTLWEHAMRQASEIPVVRIQMANALHHDGQDAAAVALLEKTLQECRPDEPDRKRIVAKIERWRKLEEKCDETSDILNSAFDSRNSRPRF